MNKIVSDAQNAIAGIEDNMTLMLGGFGLCGIPENGKPHTISSSHSKF